MSESVSRLYWVFGDDAPAWREDCEVCHGTGQVPYRIFTDDGLKDTGDLIACYECSHDDEYCKVGGHGRGSVEYRLAGRVAMDYQEGEFQFMGYGYTILPCLVSILISDFRAGTLPASLLQSDTNPDGLHKTEIKEEYRE